MKIPVPNKTTLAFVVLALPFLAFTSCQERSENNPQDYSKGVLDPAGVDPGPGTTGDTGPGAGTGSGVGTRSDYQPSTGPGSVTETQGQ